MSLRNLFPAISAIAMIAAATHSAAAQSTEDFYRQNKQITIYVGFGPGSGYDRWTRTVAHHMGKHIPGNPHFIIKNMPGAGSLVAANYVYNVAPKDGSALGAFSRNLPAQALIGRKGVKYDPRKFGWIGSPTIASRVCAVMAATKITSVDHVLNKEVIMGGTGPATAPSFIPVVLNTLLGTKFKVVEGYRSSEEVHLAMERGEVSGICQSAAAINKLHPEWVKSGKLRILFNLETTRNPQLNGAPSIFEYIKDKDNKQTLQFITSSTELGRPLVAPPGLPQARLAALRAAFDATMKDPAFLKVTARQKMVVIPKSGAELAALVNALYTIPQATVKKARALMAMGKRKKSKKKK